MWLLFMKTHTPIPEAVMYNFLRTRVAAHSVERMIQIAVAAGLFVRVAGTTPGVDGQYIPQPPSGPQPGVV